MQRLVENLRRLKQMIKGLYSRFAPDEVYSRSVVERTLHMVRQEYTVLPRFGFHQPLDYDYIYPSHVKLALREI